MNDINNIQGLLTTSQASQLLNVTSHQVASLVRAKELQAVHVAGRILLISAESISRYKLLRRGKGRPLSEDIAQAALLLLSDAQVNGISYQQNRRLKQKLQAINAEDLVWQTRKRAEIKRYRCSGSFLKELSKEIALSGLNALNDNFDLTAETENVEGYVSETKLNRLVERFFLVGDTHGNVVLRITHRQVFDNAYMPIGFVAADLSESLNTRERSAGINKLKELLDDYQKV